MLLLSAALLANHCVIVNQEGMVRDLTKEQMANTTYLMEVSCSLTNRQALDYWLAHRHDWERKFWGGHLPPF